MHFMERKTGDSVTTILIHDSHVQRWQSTRGVVTFAHSRHQTDSSQGCCMHGWVTKVLDVENAPPQSTVGTDDNGAVTTQ